jgi:hypothetical protein
MSEQIGAPAGLSSEGVPLWTRGEKTPLTGGTRSPIPRSLCCWVAKVQVIGLLGVRFCINVVTGFSSRSGAVLCLAMCCLQTLQVSLSENRAFRVHVDCKAFFTRYKKTPCVENISVRP